MAGQSSGFCDPRKRNARQWSEVPLYPESPRTAWRALSPAVAVEKICQQPRNLLRGFARWGMPDGIRHQPLVGRGEVSLQPLGRSRQHHAVIAAVKRQGWYGHELDRCLPAGEFGIARIRLGFFPSDPIGMQRDFNPIRVSKDLATFSKMASSSQPNGLQVSHLNLANSLPFLCTNSAPRPWP